MPQVQVTYDGNQRCTAINTGNGKKLALDCPLSRGEEFSPGSLFASGLAGCMLISMATFAERHSLDIAGTQVDVDMSMGGAQDTRIDAIDIEIRMPGDHSAAERKGLEKAAAACPIKHSIRRDTRISTVFFFPQGLNQREQS
jgi:uncharacterized OsmC-like protein